MSINEHVLGFVMAGGNGSRLKLLTKDRCKPELSIFGRYRIFDFVASNIANTNIPVNLIATQFKPDSLYAYIGNGEAWGLNGISRKLEIINPNEEGVIFEGTADSIRKSSYRINRYNPDIILVLGADHIYSMNYKEAIIQHEINKADITIMTNAIPDSKVSDFGIVKIDESGRIVDFAEKPTDKESIESFRLSPKVKTLLGVDDPNLNFLASMGNYVFYWDRLRKFLDFPGMDFGKDIIPAIKENDGALYAHVFDGYWRDVGRICEYFNCNMEFTKNPPLNLLECRVGICEEHIPRPQIASGSSIQDVILSPGDIVHRGSAITNSVLGYNVVIDEGCMLDHCVLLGADMNGSHNRQHNSQTDKENTTHIGKASRLSYVILEKNVWAGEGVDIGPQNGTPERRKEILQSIGLKPYRELGNGMVEGDFYIEPETGILVIGKQHNTDPKKPNLPEFLKC